MAVGGRCGRVPRRRKSSARGRHARCRATSIPTWGGKAGGGMGAPSNGAVVVATGGHTGGYGTARKRGRQPAAEPSPARPYQGSDASAVAKVTKSHSACQSPCQRAYCRLGSRGITAPPELRVRFAVHPSPHFAKDTPQCVIHNSRLENLKPPPANSAPGVGCPPLSLGRPTPRSNWCQVCILPTVVPPDCASAWRSIP